METSLRHDFEQMPVLRGTNSVKWNTYPDDVLPMWIADMDFTCAQPILHALAERVRFGVFGYATVPSSFQNAVQHWMKTRFHWDIDPEWVSFSQATVPVLVDAIDAFTQPGEKVLIQSPVYHPFHKIIGGRDRVKVVNSLIADRNTWIIDFEDLEKKLSDPDVKLMFLCNPHNPVGRVFTPGELRTVGELCVTHQVLLISDEIHQDFVYAPHKHTPMPTLSTAIADNTIVCVNPSKSFNIPGMQAAAIIVSNPDIRKRLQKKMFANHSSEPTSLGPLALEIAYTQCAYYVDQLVDYIQGNLNFLLAYVERFLPEIKVSRPEATYLLWLDCRGLGLSQEALVAFMLEQAKVALNSGSDFGEEGVGFMRMNIACHRATLEEGLNRIQRAVAQLKKRN